jgi:hypothetical protein
MHGRPAIVAASSRNTEGLWREFARLPRVSRRPRSVPGLIFPEDTEAPSDAATQTSNTLSGAKRAFSDPRQFVVTSNPAREKDAICGEIETDALGPARFRVTACWSPERLLRNPLQEEVKR